MEEMNDNERGELPDQFPLFQSLNEVESNTSQTKRTRKVGKQPLVVQEDFDPNEAKPVLINMGNNKEKTVHLSNLQVQMWLLKDLGGQMDIASSPSVVDESIIFNPNMLNPWNFSKEGK